MGVPDVDALRADLTRALVEAGFAIHHSHLPSGGVRLVTDAEGPLPGVLVSWAASVTLDSDERRQEPYAVVRTTMNRALIEVLRALGYSVTAHGDLGVARVTATAADGDP